jgi:heat shock protein HslJ
MAGPNEAPKLDGTAWILAALPGRSLLSDRPVTMRLENGRVHGTDGCNRYSAPYSATSDGFHLSAPVASTKMACPGPVTEQAEAFISALTNARAARGSGTQLVLVDADGKTLATLDAQTQELAGTLWQVISYNNGKEAVISVLAGTTISLEFSTDGKVRGSAGCNEFTATYSTSGQNLTLGESTATRKTCAHPEGVMVQERLFFNALAMSTLVRIDGDRLELRARNGALVVAAKRNTPAAAAPGDATPMLAGEMIYMADAARFTDCLSGRSYPVAMEGDFVSMERAYLKAAKQPGAPVYMTFAGAISDRPKVDGEGTERTVVVSRFIAAQPDQRCPNRV